MRKRRKKGEHYKKNFNLIAKALLTLLGFFVCLSTEFNIFHRKILTTNSIICGKVGIITTYFSGALRSEETNKQTKPNAHSIS